MECGERERRGEREERQRPPRPPPPFGITEINTYQYLQRLHDRSFHFSSQGLSAEESGDNEIAMTSYREALVLMDKVLDMDCEKLTNADSDQIDKAKTLQQKIQKTKLQIEYRIQSLERERAPQPSQDALMEIDSPPTYEEAISSPSSLSVGDSVWSTETTASINRHLSEAEQLFTVEEGAQIFYITTEGYVSAPSYPASLRVCKFSQDEVQTAGASNAPSPPPAFMQVGEWVYPLIPNTSPALQTSYGAYIFPDTQSQQPGASVGLILPETVTPEERRRFEQVLSSLTAMQEQTTTIQPSDIVLPPSTWEATPDETEPLPATRTDTSTKISKGILVAADWISWGLGKGAEKTGELIKAGSESLRKRINPVETPRPVDPKVEKGVKYARKATHVAVSVSAFLVSKLGDATVKLGQHLAPHVKKQGERILPKSLLKEGADGRSKMKGVFEVAATGVQGFGTVYMSLEAAAKALAKNLANETVVVVTHRYGKDAGTVTDNALYSVGNLGMTAFNIDNLGVKAVAKRAVKETGKSVLQHYVDEHNTHPQNTPNQNSTHTKVDPKLPDSHKK